MRRLPPSGQRHDGERGLALAIVLFAMTVLLMTMASGALIVTADVLATRNTRGASQAHFVAESGISHALQAINAVGVVDFRSNVVNQWNALFGTASRTFPAAAGYRYAVVALPDAGDPANRGVLQATATGPGGTRNVAVARVLRSNIPSTSPGAIYLATDGRTDATFNGNAWNIDGNDYRYTGGPGPAGPVPGISTRQQANTAEAVASLNAQQKNNVRGLGYQSGPPIVPSILTSPAAPTTDQLNQMVDTLFSQPGVVRNNSSQVTGNVTFGTPASPAITYFAQSTTIKGNGNASGAGILIVEGDLTIKGTLDFKGLVIVRGRTAVEGDTEVTGNATIYGAVWTNDINLVVGGSAIVRYSTQALALANQTVVTGALPAPVNVVSLADCAQLPAAVGGCP
jgi:hypothetical protein